MGLTAARERVRVAKELRELPTIAAAYGKGQVSWTQVRAITRIAGTVGQSEDDWITYARSCTGADLERLVRATRRALKPDEVAQDPEQAAYVRRPRVSYAENGDLNVTLHVPAEAGPVVLAALDRVLEEIGKERAATPPDVSAETSRASGEPTLELLEPPPFPEDTSASVYASPERKKVLTAYYAEDARVREHNREIRRLHDLRALERAMTQTLPEQPATWNDAFLRICQRVLSAKGDLPFTTKERLRIVIDPLSGWARLRDGELLPPGLVPTPREALAPLDLMSLDQGRNSRLVTAPLRRLLSDLDGERCRFPGCTRVRRLDAHHVIYWRNGGRTDLANLVLLCGRHHTLVHSEGFQLVLSPDRTLTVRTQDDIPVPPHPIRKEQSAEDLPDDVSAETLPPQLDSSRIDWDWAIYVITQQSS